MKINIKIYSWGVDEIGNKFEKSYLVYGDTKQFKDELKKMNGRFGRFFKLGGKDSKDETRVAGWIFSRKGWEKVNKWLDKLPDNLEIIKEWEAD